MPNCHICNTALGYYDIYHLDGQIYCSGCLAQVKLLKLKNNPINQMVTELQSQNNNLVKLIDQSNDITHLKNKIKKVESENKKLKERVVQLEKKLDEMIYYAPEGEGYNEAKEDFDKLKKQE